jgi:hypothetical protein
MVKPFFPLNQFAMYFKNILGGISRMTYRVQKIGNGHILFITALLIFTKISFSQSSGIFDKNPRYGWLQTARVFLLDAYQPPFAPELEYDAKSWSETMVKMNVNVLRFPTMGKYATIQGVRFSQHPDQGGRDFLMETIEACKPKGIKVIPYISTGHKLAWSMVTKDFPEYGQIATPGGKPARSHMYVGEDHGTVCWMTPYRKAFLELVEHVVRDYDIDGIYFDKWDCHYFWPGKKLCYCEGCKKGFRKATGLEIPYYENDKDYTEDELTIIDKYHHWYKETYLTEVVEKVREIVKTYKDIPLISNINDPMLMANQDPRILKSMDAFLYERGHSMLERAEGVGVPRSVGLHVWPYVGVYHNWPRLAFQGINYQQEIFTNLMFGGGSIIAQPTGYIEDSENREFVSYPFGIIKKHERILEGLESVPYVGVVFAYDSPIDHIQSGWLTGSTDARTSTRGAFSVCLYNHIQVGSISEFILDDVEKLKKYPILYLANIPYLSDKRIKNIIEYVANGGNLIASYATTLFDSKGNRQSRFGLEELFKVRPVFPEGELVKIIDSYRAMIGGPNDLYLLLKNDKKGVLNNEWANRLFPAWYYEPVEVLDGGEVLMDIVTGYNRQTILPGVVISDYGKGRVVYCSNALESLYDYDGSAIVGELLREIIEAISVKSPPYTLDAPAGLLANLTKKENLMVLHLTNWTGNKFEKPWRNEYYLSPVENIRLKIRIPEHKKIKNISMFVKTDFKKKISANNLEICIPKVEAYQAIVIEME